MGALRKILLILLLTGAITVIIATWGSIGSAVMTLALLLSGGMILLKTILDNRDPDDFRWED